MRFFISDTHFGHANIIQYCDRPFNDVVEMDRTMIKQWNLVVEESDEVFFVGDVTFSSDDRTRAILDQLRGTKHLILGNHDYSHRKVKKVLNDYFVTVEESRSLFLESVGRTVNLCHYPLYGLQGPPILIHGHSHNHRPLVTTDYATQRLRVNVSVENLDYTPMDEERLAQIIKIYDESLKGDL